MNNLLLPLRQAPAIPFPLPKGVPQGFRDSFSADPVGTQAPGGWVWDSAGLATHKITTAGYLIDTGGGGGANNLYTSTFSAKNVLVEAELTSISIEAEVIGRYVADNNKYSAVLSVSQGLGLFYSGTQLGSWQAASASGTHRLGLCVSGTTIQAILDGSVRLSVTDSSSGASGAVGIRSYDGAATFRWMRAVRL